VRRAVTLVLGAVFLASGALKFAAPAETVLAVGAYDLLPPRLALLAGIALPGLEVAVGASLIAGWLAAGAAALAGLLALGFLAFVVSATVRGIDVACGCFGALSAATQAGWGTALLDVALLAASVVAWRSRVS